MAPPPLVLLDDRLLIEELLVGLGSPAGPITLGTTSSWYYRACRAAVLGAGGFLSGPFERVAPSEQRRAVRSLLELRLDLALPDARASVPLMAGLAERHPRLNLMNLEAAAVARLWHASVRLSGPASKGVLPAVLDAEGLEWTTVPTRTR